MDEARLNSEELSRRIGLPASTIKKIRNNHDSNPTLSTLSPIAKYFTLSISQLIGDEPFPESRLKGAYRINERILSHIPVISWEMAVLWPSADITPKQTITSEHQYSTDSFALIVEEDDWENLAVGTSLIIDPSLKPAHRDYIIVHRTGQKSPTLRQALFDEGQSYLKPVTPGYNITALTPEHNILGVVVEYKKYLKNTFQLKYDIV